MQFDAWEDVIRGEIRVRSSGRFRPTDIFDLCDELSSFEGYRRGHPVFHDARAVDFDVPTSDVIIAARAPLLPPQTGLPRLGVILVSCPLSYGMARVFTSLREGESAMYHVTRCTGDAYAWLDRMSCLAA